MKKNNIDPAKKQAPKICKQCKHNCYPSGSLPPVELRPKNCIANSEEHPSGSPGGYAQSERCENVIGAYSVSDGKKVLCGPIRCNNWNCPYCGPQKKKSLWRRILKGFLGDLAKYNRYGLKHLTLTCPGKEFRLRYQGRPDRVYEIMAGHFANMIRSLRGKYGHFHYFRVCEMQKDGMPHFHVLLAGNAIAPKEILGDIEHYWRNLYGMGFVRLNMIGFRDGKHAVNYMLKYITKDSMSAGKHKRIFTASLGALLKIDKKKWEYSSVFFGRLNDKGVHEEAIIQDEGWVEFEPGHWKPVSIIAPMVVERHMKNYICEVN